LVSSAEALAKLTITGLVTMAVLRALRCKRRLGEGLGRLGRSRQPLRLFWLSRFLMKR
jgi:hypothetical protein